MKCIFIGASLIKKYFLEYINLLISIKIEKNNKVAFIPIIRKLDLNNFEAFSPYGYGDIWTRYSLIR